jgi:hypothetical protein
VSNTGIKCLKSGLFLDQMKNCDKYLYVWQCDECEVKHWNSEGHLESSHLRDQVVGEDGPMSQWVADGHVMVQSHGQQDAWLYTLKGMDKPHLKKAGIKVDFGNMKLGDSKHLGHNAASKCNACGS